MEPYSHSHSRSHFNGHKKPPNFPTNGNNGGGYVATSYDDVFGGPPKYATLAPRAEDYSEIFGAFRSSAACTSRASSIPALDLPDVTDIGAGGGVEFDYSDVFGGFDDVGFAVSFDELFGPVDAHPCCSASSDGDDEAWTPIGTESLSDDSDPFALSEKSLNENLHQPLEKQFSVSYNKVNLGTNMCISNMTHVAQLNAVPGFTCVVDETTSLRETGEKGCNPAEVDDIVFNVNSSSSLPEKHKIKNISEMSLDTGLNSFDGNHVHLRAYAASTSHVSPALESVSDINHVAKSSDLPSLSRLPSEAAKRKGEISSTSGLKTSDDCSSEALDNKLPPCFDMEVDGSSIATASAADMKDAMKKAQAKLKAAPVLMGRKKGGLEGIADIGLTANGDGGNNVKTSFDEFAYGDNRLETESGKCATTLQSLPDNPTVQQRNFVAVKPAERKHERKCNSSTNSVFIEGDGEWKEETQYYEFVSGDSSRVAPQPPSNVDGRKTSSSMKQFDEHNSDSAEDVIVPEGNRPRLKTIKSVSRQAYYDKMFKVVQEVHDGTIGGYMNRDHELTSNPQGNHKEHKGKSGYECEKNARKIGHMQQVEKNSTSNGMKIKSKNDFGDEEIKKKEGKKKGTKACHLEESDQKTYSPRQGKVKEFPEMKEEKRRMKELYGRVESDWSVPEIVGGTERQKKAKEAYEEQKMEKKLADAVEQKKGKKEREVKEKRSKEPSENDFDGNGLQTSGNQEVSQTKDMKRKLEGERPRKTFVDVFGREKLERTRDFQENNNKIDAQLRNEDGNFVEVAVSKEGFERILEECVELGEHQKYQEASEQLIGLERQGQDEYHKPASTYKESEESPNRVNNGKKLEKSVKHGIEDKTIQVDEMDEAVKISKKTGDAEKQNFVCGSPIIIEWRDDDQGSERSSETELPVENEYLKSSGSTVLHGRIVEVQSDTPTAKFRSSMIAADDLQNVWAHKNGKVSVGSCDKDRNLKSVDTAYVLIDEKPTESSAAEMGGFDSKGERIVRASDSSDENENNSKSGELFDRSCDIMKHKNEKIAQSVPDPMLVKDYDIEEGERRLNLGGAYVLCDHNDKGKSTPARAISGCNEREHAKSKDEVHADMPVNWKENIEKRSHLPDVSQSTDQKGKISNQNCNFEEKTEKKVNDFKEEQLRMLEEERERQREREKDRKAVELAIREARERAYADARDKAERNAIERAADEARQRMMNEARERLEKACAEARERSLADKALEARLKADRVAVERAIAEGRQQVIEKAMAERATFEARERMQRSISEKYLPERDVVKRQSSMPSMHSEEFEAGDVEPAQRCKARLERHHRTVERVAKALAEKNMRDLLAQKEQAERSRLAETLGADIKRWSNGKEGNLRALLSTLQYILGPDSGWQPIPLTEVITATAVKKAYRKAALCVHPDKLQQRGASIQQKYVCEKVFDLLKEAWNRFNSEEK